MDQNPQQNSDESKVKRVAEIMRLATENLRIFVPEIIGLHNAQFHNEMDDCLSLELNKKMCIAVARGHGKTSHISVAYPLWEIGKNHNVRILLVSSTADITRRCVTEIVAIYRNRKTPLVDEYDSMKD